jgi:hypothetical protein
MTVRGYLLGIDWSGAGSYAGTLEDVSSYVDRTDISFGWGRSIDNPTSLAAPSSQMTFSLRNRDRAWDRYFSPENTSSPISGKIAPGKGVRLSRTVDGGQTTQYSETWTTTTAGWTASGGGTISRVASPTEDGNGSLQYVPPGAVASVAVVGGTRTPLFRLAEGTVVASFRLLSSAGYSNIVPQIDWYDAAGSFISTSGAGSQSATATVWTTIQTSALAPPSTAVYATPRLTLTGTPPNTNTFNVDNVSLIHKANDAGKTYLLRQDALDDFTIDSMSTARTFAATSMDAWGRSDSAELSTGIYSGLRTGDAIGLVLDSIGWTGPRAIDAGATFISYWWEEGTDPATAIDKIVNSEGPPAIAYVEAGTFVFRDRHHRILSTASNTSQGLITHTFPAGPQGADYKVKANSFTYNHGTKDVVDSVTFSQEVRDVGSYGEVWAQEEPITMATGETRVIVAQPTDPVISVSAPNYADGSLQSSSGVFSATINRSSGQSITIFLTAVAGGTLTRINLFGSLLPVVRTVQVTASKAGSGSSRGNSNWPNPAPWCNPYDAQVVANRIISLYSDNRPRVTFTLVNFNDRYLSKILALRISDRLTIKNDVLGVNRDFYVERLEHRISRLQMHEVTVTCVVTEPQQASNALTFDVAGKGFNDGAFAADSIDNAANVFVFDSSGHGFDQGLFAN